MNEILAIDPGREKCGIAVCSPDGKLLRQAVAGTDRLPEAVEEALSAHFCQVCVLGKGTGSDEIKQTLVSRFAPTLRIVEIEEAGTTLLARGLYFKQNPPRGLQKLLPAGMRVPRGPVDGYAAWAIALKYLDLMRSGGHDD